VRSGLWINKLTAAAEFAAVSLLRTAKREVAVMPYMAINGIRLYYELRGTGEVLALFNGIMQNTAGWALQTRTLSRYYQLLLHDMRGQGRSDKPAYDYSWDMHVEDFRALLDELQIEKIHLAGVSYGAEVAMYFARKYPERVKSLVIGTATSVMTPLLQAFARSWEAAALCRDGRTFFKLFLPSVYSNDFLASSEGWLERRAEEFSRAVNEEWFQGFERLVKNFLTLNLTSELKHIQVPSLVIAAEKDILTPPELSYLIHSELPVSEWIVFPGTGHVVVFEKPEEFNTAVLGFLRKVK
jgi:pimeloyl-ACP methyl ester carboxylesterase